MKRCVRVGVEVKEVISKEFIKYAMKVRGKTQNELAEKCGYANQTSVSTILNAGSSMMVDNLVMIASELGYDIYAIDREEGRKVKITDKKKFIKGKETRDKKGKEEKVEKPVEQKEIPTFQYGRR